MITVFYKTAHSLKAMHNCVKLKIIFNINCNIVSHTFERLSVFVKIVNHFTSRPKCMSGSRDPGVTKVNPTEISVMYGYVT